MQRHAESAQTLQQFCPYQNQDFFCKPFPQMMLCTLSSGLGGLWTLYDPLLIKAAQPENLFSLKVFFLYISNLCQPQKLLNKVTFLTEQRCSELQERTNQLKGLMWLISRLHLFFLHSNCINQCTPRCTVDKRYGNLATSIGPITKSYTSTTLITFNSLKGSVFQASHASHSWEAVNNHMRSCKSLDKPAKQARMLTQGV